MTRDEIVEELKRAENIIHELNMSYRYGSGKRPSEANPEICARRNELREMLVKRLYDSGDDNV